MVPQVYSDKILNSDTHNSFELYKYRTSGKVRTDDTIGVIFLREKLYINDVNGLEMDASPKDEHGNVSVLKSEQFEYHNRQHQDDLVIQQNSNLEENWWSACQPPVFIVIFAIIGVLAIALVTLLWLKRQMIQREKNKKIVALDSNPIQLSSNSCSCPNPGLASDDRWIYHTVINLKNSGPDGDSSNVEDKSPEHSSLGVVVNEAKDVEKRDESVRVKAKGLLERRGSNASLTIDLPQTAFEGRTRVVTPTRECMTEEFLLSAGNVLSRLQLKNCLKNVQSLHQEFWEIPLNHPEKSVVTGCGTKNRYQSILPNERTRVKLNEKEDQSLDAYINANYIRGYEGEEKAYIATQGPLPNTVEDLYRMAWNEKSPIIVMITKFFEKTKVKCESYFPTVLNETVIYGDFRVTVLSVQQKDGYSVRDLFVENECESRNILHYWYDTWPDHKTPQNAHSIVAMATEIEKCRVNFRNKSLNNNDGKSTSYGPVIVHCSAGIGRTGCFIAISLAICQLLEEDKVDILGIVCQMRCDRGGMIQTAEQYEFVHRAIALFEHSLPDSQSE
ncbi:hypothetical protein RUM44_004691 [Polyplax serrata]|uniref:protein-tyrosine-phosphatase n=1 Tax=Polyplax serrata TaxID=468196 RepID=A0ABR1B5A4_POLSC